MNDPAPATLPVPTAPATAIEVATGFSASGRIGRSICVGARRSCASTVIWPLAVALPPIEASVVTSSTATATATPTEMSLDKAAPAATVCGLKAAIACTVSNPVDVRLEPARVAASVVKSVTTLMATDPATEADPLPPAAAAAQAVNSLVLSAGGLAAIVIPAPAISDPAFTTARLDPVATFRATPTPTLVPSLSIPREVPTALAVISTSAWDWIVTAFFADTSAPLVIDATLCALRTLTATEAATPIPPDLPPPCPPALPSGPDFRLSAEGSLVSAPLVLALSLSCRSACASAPVRALLFLLLASGSVALAPLAVATAIVLLATVDSEVRVKAPPDVVIPRARRASVPSEITATATEAPTATPLPAARASALVSKSPVWDATMVTSPVAAMVVPVPSQAFVVSWMTATAAPMPIAVLAEVAPFSAWVRAVVADVAPSLTVPATPDHVVLSAIFAIVVLFTTFTATEAPTPTLLPCPPPLDGRARETLSALLTAVIERLPPPVIAIDMLPTGWPTLIPFTTAWLLLMATFTATAPANPILPPLPPEIASARDALVASMKV